MVKGRREKSAFRENVESIIIAIILAFVMRQFVVQAFKIPSGSMEQTLLVGDHILVNKFLYRFTDPKLFDVIVFRYPWEEKRDFIKRVIALPGDEVHIRGQRIWVNDQRLTEPYAQYSLLHGRENEFGPLWVPKKGDEIEIRADKHLYHNGELVKVPMGRFYPRDRGGGHVRVRSVLRHSVPTWDHVGQAIWTDYSSGRLLLYSGR